MGYRGEQGNGLYGMCTSVVGFSTTERRWGANEKKKSNNSQSSVKKFRIQRDTQH